MRSECPTGSSDNRMEDLMAKPTLDLRYSEEGLPFQ